MLAKNPLLSGGLVMFVGMMGVNVINYFYHLVMGRTLGPVGYGSLAAIFSILYIAGVVPVSSSFAIVKFMSVSKNGKEKSRLYAALKKLYSKIAIVVLAVLLLLSPLIASFINLSDVKSVMLIGPIVFFTIMTVVNTGSLQGLLKFSGVVISNTILAVGKLSFGLVLVYLGFNYFGAVMGIGVAGLLAFIYSTWAIKRHIRIKKYSTKYDLKPFTRYALPVLVQSLAFTSMYSMDLILVKHFLPPFEAGLYAALSTMGKIIYFAISPIVSVMFPVVSSKRSKGENYRKSFYLSFFVAAIMGMGITALYYLLPSFTINSLYGSEYTSAASTLALMGIFMSLYSLSYFLVNFLLSVHKTLVAVIPAAAAVGQVVFLWVYHDSLEQVLQVNIAISFGMFSLVILYLMYNECVRRNVLKTTKT